MTISLKGHREQRSALEVRSEFSEIWMLYDGERKRTGTVLIPVKLSITRPTVEPKEHNRIGGQSDGE